MRDRHRLIGIEEGEDIVVAFIVEWCGRSQRRSSDTRSE